jgi:chemotaxis protein histidine kinase CheA
MTSFFKSIKRFTTGSKEPEIGPFTRLLSNNGVEIIQTADDGNCFYDAFYRSVLTIENDELKNRIFDPILDTLQDEDLPNLLVDGTKKEGNDRKEYIKTINLGAFRNATPVISSNYTSKTEKNREYRLFKYCQTLFIRCCRRYIANNLDKESLKFVFISYCNRGAGYSEAYQEALNSFLATIFQKKDCPPPDDLNPNIQVTDEQLTMYKNALEMIKPGRVPTTGTSIQRRPEIASVLWAGVPEMEILQEKLNIYFLNFKNFDQILINSAFQTIGGYENLNDDTLFVPLAYNGLHYEALAGHNGNSYKSTSLYADLPNILKMLSCFQFVSDESPFFTNKCTEYIKIKQLLKMSDQIRLFPLTNYNSVVKSKQTDLVYNGFMKLVENISILKRNYQVNLLTTLREIFQECSGLKDEAQLAECKANNGRKYKQASDTFANYINLAIGNNLIQIKEYVTDLILKLDNANWNKTSQSIIQIYDAMAKDGNTISIFPNTEPEAKQFTSNDELIAFVTRTVGERIDELNEAIENKDAEPTNIVDETLDSIEEQEQREQREEQERKTAAAQAKLAEAAAKQAAAKQVKEAREAAKKEAAEKAAKEATERAEAKKREAEIQAVISPFQTVAKKQIQELKDLITEWKRKENEWKEAKDRLTQYDLRIEDESNLLETIKNSEQLSSALKDKKKQFTKEEKAELNKITKELKGYRNFNNANIRYSKAFKDLARVALQFFKLRKNTEQSITYMNAALEKIRNQLPKSASEGVGEGALPELPTTADLYQEFQDRIKKLDDPLVTYLFESEDLTDNENVLRAFSQSYRPKGSKIDKFQKMNTEIRSLLLKITPNPYANVHQEQLNLLTDTSLDSLQRYTIANEINRTTQSIIAPWLEKPEGSLAASKSGGGKRQRKYTATRNSTARKARKSNSARGNKSGTRRRGRFARSRSLPRRKLAGHQERSQKVHSKPNQRTRRPQRK